MTKAEPGWGYRFLEAGERTQEGDECRDFDFEKWRPVDEGWSVHPGEGHLYRRPIGEFVTPGTYEMDSSMMVVRR
jgi:hypothetical protein